MMNFKYTIKDPIGIHARPAGKLVKLANTFNAKITIEKNNKKIEANKLFALITLGVKQGNDILVTIDGEDEEQAFSAIKLFFEENL